MNVIKKISLTLLHVLQSYCSPEKTSLVYSFQVPFHECKLKGVRWPEFVTIIKKENTY